MTSLAPSFAPPNAVRMWMDDHSIYVELPVSPGYESTIPCILAFAISEQGLSKALNILRQRRTNFSGPPLVPSPKSARTAEQKSILRGIIRNGMP